MKKFSLILIVSSFLMAESFSKIVKEISNSYVYKLSKNEVLLAKKSLKAAKGLNLGKVDLSYEGIRFFQTPIMKMDTPTPVAVAPDGSLIYKDIETEASVMEKNHFIGEIKYSYPIFTGYKITSLINIAKLNLIKANLKLKNTRRVLILNAAKLYAAIYALNAKIKALDFEKRALLDAKEKALALLKEGLVDKSFVDDIKAKYYEVVASLKETESKRDSLLNDLSSLLNVKISSIASLDSYSLNINKLNPKNRPDVREVYKNLEIAKNSLILAKSAYYPTLGFEIGLKKEADNLFLSENKHQNIDRSYMALGVKWNLFNGFRDKMEVEKAKIQEINAVLFYKNYLNEAKTDLKNDLIELKALKYRLKAVNNEIAARETYYEKIKAKFEEGLADSVDLNTAIAKLAEAKAMKEYIRSQIFFYTIKAKLDGGDDEI